MASGGGVPADSAITPGLAPENERACHQRPGQGAGKDDEQCRLALRPAVAGKPDLFNEVQIGMIEQGLGSHPFRLQVLRRHHFGGQVLIEC